MGKDSATGSFQLFVGKAVSTILLAIGSIIVGIFINPYDYGLYAIALVPAATFLLFQDWGVGTALTMYCANYRAEKKESDLRNIILSVLTFEVVTGLSLTLLSLFTANFIASTIYNNPESGILIAFASISILSVAVYSVCVSVFVGYERMDLGTITIVVSSVAQGFLSPLLVYLGFGSFGAVAGYTISSIASGVTGLGLLYFTIFKKLPPANFDRTKMFQTLKPLVRYGIPVAIATILGGVTSQIISFIMASSTNATLIGNYKIATNFAVLSTLFVYPIQTVLFPTFSKLDPFKDKTILKTVYSSSVKYSSLFIMPAIVALMVLSGPLVSTIYGNKWPFAPLYLTLYVSGDLLVLLGGLVYGRLFYATGKTQIIMKLNFLVLCIGAPLALLLIPSFGIVGVIIVNAITGTIISFIGIYWTWKLYEVKPDFRNSGKILCAAVIAGLITYLLQIVLSASGWMPLVLGTALFLGVYLFSIPLIGAVNQTDLANLRVMFSGLGPISKMLQLILTLVEIPFRVKQTSSKASG